jgi:hypothetical protein
MRSRLERIIELKRAMKRKREDGVVEEINPQESEE